MSRQNIMDRARELTPTPGARSRDLNGTYWNDKQFRLERWFGGRLVFWMAHELLRDIGKGSDDHIRRVIADTPEPGASTLADFFFPGWKINHYVRTGERIDS
jgi:hypothetical protein